jgi:hypothetical protein
MSDSEDALPEDVEAAAQAAISTLLPEKSKQLYESAEDYSDACLRIF